MISEKCINLFQQSIKDYHVKDSIDAPLQNPFAAETFEHLLYVKSWIDTVQWHLEDVIRDPQIDAVAALQIKRRIDESNQRRTDMVEFIDAYFLQQYKEVQP